MLLGAIPSVLLGVLPLCPQLGIASLPLLTGSRGCPLAEEDSAKQIKGFGTLLGHGKGEQKQGQGETRL